MRGRARCDGGRADDFNGNSWAGNRYVGRGGVTVSRSGPDAAGLVRVKKVFAPIVETVPDVGTEVTRGWTPWVMQMTAGEPNSCRWSGGFSERFRRGSWDAMVYGDFEVTSTPEAFHVKESVRATEGGQDVFKREWDHVIKRDLM